MKRKPSDTQGLAGGLSGGQGGGGDAGMRAGWLVREAHPLLVSHRGALGDFLVSWPAIRALALARSARPQAACAPHGPDGPGGPDGPDGPHGQGGPCPPLLWAGRPDYLFFLEPLGVRRADPALLRAVDRHYGGDEDAFPAGAGLVRFALKPGTSFGGHERVVSIYSIGAEGFDPPGKRQAEALAGLGVWTGLEAGSKKHQEETYNNITNSIPELPAIQTEEAQTGSGPGGQAGSGSEVPASLGPELPDAPKEWFPGSLAVFREAFGSVDVDPQTAEALASLPASPPAPPASGRAPAPEPDPAPLPSVALLFPGAGHPAKAWPLVQYFELARRLPELGLAPVFVLGPAEIERGMDAGGYPQVRPGSLAALTGLLNRAALVVGNDSGPLHLAGMLGRPAVGLFGPSSRRQWGPPGVTALARAVPCRPCTRTTAGLDCPEPVCLTELPVDTVLAAVRQRLTPGADRTPVPQAPRAGPGNTANP